ncbi:MAG: hypothetical protein DRO40_10015 [Thermoprotei archaeon]|nr:MAG: hypothetical protein DRO40_10015 [Thermoprotei archaeon]
MSIDVEANALIHYIEFLAEEVLSTGISERLLKEVKELIGIIKTRGLVRRAIPELRLLYGKLISWKGTLEPDELTKEGWTLLDEILEDVEKMIRPQPSI